MGILESDCAVGNRGPRRDICSLRVDLACFSCRCFVVEKGCVCGNFQQGPLWKQILRRANWWIGGEIRGALAVHTGKHTSDNERLTEKGHEGNERTTAVNYVSKLDGNNTTIANVRRPMAGD